MREIHVNLITQAVREMVAEACFSLTAETKKMMEYAASKETDDTARFALDALLNNANMAANKHIPVCQDTGMAILFIEYGQEVHFTGGNLVDAVNEGVRIGYKENFCRNSVLDPITRLNTRDNTPAVIHTELTDGDQVKITFMPKGFGSENMSKLYMLTPAMGVSGVMDKVVEAVKTAGSNPCPPIVVGVGIGGTADYAMLLAKKALMREGRSADGTLADMEMKLLKRINDLRIGAQGFGGDTTAFDVRIEKYPTHIAALPVGVSIQCNAHRLARRTL